jgi:hypothetical protein
VIAAPLALEVGRLTGNAAVCCNIGSLNTETAERGAEDAEKNWGGLQSRWLERVRAAPVAKRSLIFKTMRAGSAK